MEPYDGQDGDGCEGEGGVFGALNGPLGRVASLHVHLLFRLGRFGWQ